MEGGQLGGDEWTRHGSFVNKPTRGWLHSDGVVSTAGVSYTVRVCDRDSLPYSGTPVAQSRVLPDAVTHTGESFSRCRKSLHNCFYHH